MSAGVGSPNFAQLLNYAVGAGKASTGVVNAGRNPPMLLFPPPRYQYYYRVFVTHFVCIDIIIEQQYSGPVCITILGGREASR